MDFQEKERLCHQTRTQRILKGKFGQKKKVPAYHFDYFCFFRSRPFGGTEHKPDFVVPLTQLDHTRITLPCSSFSLQFSDGEHCETADYFLPLMIGQMYLYHVLKLFDQI